MNPGNLVRHVPSWNTPLWSCQSAIVDGGPKSIGVALPGEIAIVLAVTGKNGYNLRELFVYVNGKVGWSHTDYWAIV